MLGVLTSLRSASVILFLDSLFLWGVVHGVRCDMELSHTGAY